MNIEWRQINNICCRLRMHFSLKIGHVGVHEVISNIKKSIGYYVLRGLSQVKSESMNNLNLHLSIHGIFTDFLAKPCVKQNYSPNKTLELS